MTTTHRFFLFSVFVLGGMAGFVACTSEKSTAALDVAPVGVSPNDWPWWRGPNRDGIAQPSQKPPLHWSDSKNVLWRMPIPGRGHGSPIVVEKQVVLATADEKAEIQSLISHDRGTGKLLWKTDIHKGGFTKKGNRKASQASSTPAFDGERFYINFLNRDAVYTTALTAQGKKVWQQQISDYVVHQGYGASPAIYGPLVIAIADTKRGGAICGLDRKSGDIVWRVERPKTPNYPSPIILTASGRDQLFLTGCDLVSGLDPLTGKKFWEVEGATTECVTSTVTDGAHIYTSGGYPKNHLSAVRTDGSGKVAWEKSIRVYVPSMVARGGYLYAVSDAGVAYCFNSATGEELWKKRLGGKFTSSPVLVGERLYATNEKGKTFIYSADPQKFEIFAENQLGDEVYATPTFCGGRIYMRVAHEEGDGRQEMLYCLGER